MRSIEWVVKRTRQPFARFASLADHTSGVAYMAKARKKSKTTRAQPLLAAALFCINVLEEKEGLPTLVRVLDQLTIPPPPELPPAAEGEKQPKLGVPLIAFVAFKSGDATGDYQLRIDMVSPSGEREPMAMATMRFLGGANGVNVNATLAVPVAEEGLYWYEILVDETLVTRMPLQLRIAREAQPQPAAPVAPAPPPGRRKKA
jgi:hypothetical protein